MVDRAREQRRPRLRLRELLRNSSDQDLPPGQRAVSEFPRFSRTPMQRLPTVPTNPALRIVGAVTEVADIPVGDLQRLSRPDGTADFTCGTPWCVRALRWTGVPFRAFYEDIVTSRCRPSADVGWLRLVGLDGGSPVVALEDALCEDVLLADALQGEPLTLRHGAPLRFVSPAQYAYKSVKHLVSIELSVEQPALGTNEHPRARVALE